jgi:drug/metabolite transporter (DMT)-like permease
MPKKAIQFMIISALAFTFLNVFVKQLLQFHVYQIVFFRSVGSVFFTMGFLLRYKIPIFGNQKSLLVIRSLVGVTSMALFFAAMKHLPIGTAVSLRYIAPIFAAFFAIIFLHEKIKHIQWLFFAIAFSGVLILKGFDTQINTIGLLFALSAALLSGVVFILLRKIGKRDHPVVVVNYFMIIAAILSGILVVPYWKNPVGIEWLLLGCLGVFGYFGQIYMTKAFQAEETNQVAPLKYLEVIFTMAIGLSWFDETYTLWGLIGIFLIVIGLTLNIIYGRANNKVLK